MKTNLDKLFKTDTKMESEGIWMMISETTGFLVRRFGGSNEHRVKAAMARHYKPYARLIQNDTLPKEKEDELLTRIFVESCLMDWKGVEIDGKDTSFEKETAVGFLLALPELRSSLQSYATDSQNYKEDLGNS
jgi:uncharacterized coiled-coil DUF342 family protein